MRDEDTLRRWTVIGLLVLAIGVGLTHLTASALS
jgi:hypothetical protein